MQVFILFSIAIAIIAIVFAVQNNATITVAFMGWSFTGSMALVILISLATGVVMSSLASLPPLFKARWRVRSQRKTIEELERRVADQVRRLEDAAPPGGQRSEQPKAPPSPGTNNPVV